MTLRWQPTANCRYETLGADTASSCGTVITSSASVNNKGSWVDIGSTTSFPYHILIVGIGGTTAAANYLVDIGINVSGSRFTIVSNLRIPALKGGNSRGGGLPVLPLHVPAGSQLSARCSASTGSSSAHVTITGGSTGFGGMPGYSRCVAFFTATSCRGPEADPSTANTKTAFRQSDSSTSDLAHALMFAVGPYTETTRTAARDYLLDVAIGGAGSEAVIVANIPFKQDADGDAPLPTYFGPVPIMIPAATRLSYRCQTSDSTSGERQVDVAFWGFVP